MVRVFAVSCGCVGRMFGVSRVFDVTRVLVDRVRKPMLV